MEVKLFEVRDRATFIAALALRLMHNGEGKANTESDRWLLRRAGYDYKQIDPLIALPLGLEPYVLFCRLDGGGEVNYDPYSWRNRTMHVAHDYVLKNWNTLHSGCVIDVEFILGETEKAKITERLDEICYEGNYGYGV